MQLYFEIFPDGPDSVDVAVTSDGITALIKGRMVFGYIFNEEQHKFLSASLYKNNFSLIDISAVQRVSHIYFTVSFCFILGLRFV